MTPLLGLPRELRDLIYATIFYSTRLTYGARLVQLQNDRQLRTIRPTPNSLAILRTCHRIWEEAHDAWLGQVTFCFESPKAFLEKLHTLPDEVIARMRRMRIFYHHGEFASTDGVNPETHYYLPTLPRLFPTLRLDSLTVLNGCTCGMAASEYVKLFLLHGEGWRELRFVCDDPGDIHNWDEESAVSDLKPEWYSNWRKRFLGRDGEKSGSSVRTFQAGKSKPFGEVINLTRDEMTEIDLSTANTEKESHPGSHFTQEKELLIIAKRGKHADVAPLGPYKRHPWEPSDEDIVEFKNRIGWPRLLELYSDICLEEPWFKHANTAEFDHYDHVDDFTWHHHPNDIYRRPEAPPFIWNWNP